MPPEPPPTEWDLGPPGPDDGEIVGVGGDLEPGTLLAAYRAGLFPMPVDGGERERDDVAVIGWWSPDPRGVIPLDGLRVTRSLRRSLRRYDVTADAAFDEVIDACRDPSRDRGWITPAIRDAYVELHRLGWAHSVEAWTPDGRLAGGLYGVAIGGLFAGESMFHVRPDASKVALVHLVELLHDEVHEGGRLLDVQWVTPHLATLGATEVPRARYLVLLDQAIQCPGPRIWGR